MGRMGEGSQKYKLPAIRKSRRCSVQNGSRTSHCIAYLKVAERVLSYHLHHTHTISLCMVTDANWTYSSDHFVTYANIESLRCTPETKIMLYFN